jgi:hypothetical protein
MYKVKIMLLNLVVETSSHAAIFVQGFATFLFVLCWLPFIFNIYIYVGAK